MEKGQNFAFSNAFTGTMHPWLLLDSILSLPNYIEVKLLNFTHLKRNQISLFIKNQSEY